MTPGLKKHTNHDLEETLSPLRRIEIKFAETGLTVIAMLLFIGVASLTLGFASHAVAARAHMPNDTAAQRTAMQRDGQHDFGFNFGTWKTHISRLQHPLASSTTWVEYDGISVVRKVWDGRANIFELKASDPAGRIEDVGLRSTISYPISACIDGGLEAWK